MFATVDGVAVEDAVSVAEVVDVCVVDVDEDEGRAMLVETLDVTVVLPVGSFEEMVVDDVGLLVLVADVYVFAFEEADDELEES